MMTTADPTGRLTGPGRSDPDPVTTADLGRPVDRTRRVPTGTRWSPPARISSFLVRMTGPHRWPRRQQPRPPGTRVAVNDRASVVARRREQFGGIKVGSAFFGWLTATGMSVLLIASLTAGGPSGWLRTPR